MITQLTEEQKAKMPEYAQAWIAKGLSTQNPPRSEAEEAVRLAYRCAGLDEPKTFIWCESPLHSGVCYAALEQKVSVRNSVSASVSNSVWNSVRKSVSASVIDSVRNSVSASVSASVSNSVWASLHVSVWDSVSDSVSASAIDSVIDSVRISVYGAHESGWLSFYAFIENELGVDCSKLQGLMECADKCGWFVALKDVVIMSPKPSICKTTHLRDRHVLHSDSGPALYYCDDFQIFALWGVRLDKALHQKITTRTITAKEVLALDNIEQRMVALKYLGDNTILEALGSTLLKEQDGYELFLVNGFERKEYALRYWCPSTKRVYVSFVEPEIGKEGDPILAVASKWKMTKKEWLSIKAHA